MRVYRDEMLAQSTRLDPSPQALARAFTVTPIHDSAGTAGHFPSTLHASREGPRAVSSVKGVAQGGSDFLRDHAEGCFRP